MPNRSIYRKDRGLLVRKLAIVISALAFLILATVSVISLNRPKEAVSTQAYEDAVHALHEKYYSGTIKEARQALLDEINLISSQKYDVARRADQAHMLSLGYSRLCRLDKSAGDATAAQKDFEDAKTWYERSLDASNESSTAVEADMNAYTEELCIDIALRYDQVRPNFDQLTSRPTSGNSGR
jgi:hypothetical protein